MTTETKPKRSRKKPVGVSAPPPPIKAPREPREMDTRNAELEYRRMAVRGSRDLLAALARSAFRHGIALRNMTPEEQLRAALADGWQGRVIGASRWAGGA
jgi:hypothetical protein